MKIKSLRIEKLFGNKTFEINFDNPTGKKKKTDIAILEAINGSGKTTILKLIKAALSTDIFGLVSVQYKQMEIELKSNKNSIYIFENNCIDKNGEYISLEELIHEKAIDTLNNYSDMDNDVREHFEKKILKITRQAKQGEKTSTSIEYTLADIIADIINVSSRDNFDEWDVDPRWLMRIGRLSKEKKKEIICPCEFIDTKRLLGKETTTRGMGGYGYGYHETRTKETIKNCNEKIKGILSKPFDNFNRLLYEKLKNFQSVLATYQEPSSKDKDRKQTEYDNLVNKYQILGLLESNEKEYEHKTEQGGMPDQYVEKLIDTYNYCYMEIFNETVNECFERNTDIQKLIVLQDVINDFNEYTGKFLKFSHDKGAIYDNNGCDIELRQLSSGEQHMFVMFYNLLFNSKDIVLIDEPEISLHVAWQIEYLDKLNKIAEKLSDMPDTANIKQFIIATHSPFIAKNHTDALVDLSECIKN